MTVDSSKVSEEQFYQQEDEDSPYQFLDGELVVCEPVSDLHEDLFSFLSTLFRTTLDERGGALARGSRYPMRLDPQWSPEPDLMVVLDESRHRMGPQRLEGPADLVIEIASPGDVGRALRLKLPRYREARVPEIWVVNAYAQSVRVEVLKAAASATGAPGAVGAVGGEYRCRELTTGRLRSVVLPWFWIEVSWLWQRPLPPTLACVMQILA
jgi:Uma2 family endonuclease